VKRNKVRKTLALLLALLILSPTVFLYTRAANETFSDTTGHWAEAYIGKWAAAGVIFGYGDGTFRPENNVTKAEFSSVLNQLFEYAEESSNTFDDVENADWFAPIISRLVAADIIVPDYDNMIRPNSTLTRGELIVMMAKAYNIPATQGETSFMDDAAIDASQRPYVKALQDAGLIVGYEMPNGYEIRANRLLTRAEMLTVLDRADEGQRQNSLPNLSPTVSATLTPTPLSTPVVTPSGGGSGGNRGGGNGSDPGSDGSEPTIVVHTAFPSGRVNNIAIEVTYTATPSRNAIITEVSYMINQTAEEYLFLAGGNGITARGTLGTGRVLLVPGENNIVFTVRDSTGRTATFDVSNTPYYDFGTIARRNPDNIVPLPSNPRIVFTNNRLIADANAGVTMEQVAAAADTVGGRIVGHINIMRSYDIEVETSTEEELLRLSTQLMDTGLFSVVTLDIATGSVPFSMETSNESLVNTRTATQWLEARRDPWWDDGTQWGLDAISLPAAWRAYGEYLSVSGRYLDDREPRFGPTTRNVTLGIIDNGVRYSHEDINISFRNVYNLRSPGTIIGPRYTVANHGTHVMGTIGAVYNNDRGIAGVKNTCRFRLLSFDSFDAPIEDRYGNRLASSDRDILIGLTWNVVRGAKAINVSLGGYIGDEHNDTNVHWRERTENWMRDLINYGYDFIVVQAAGNGHVVNEQHRLYNASVAGAFNRVRDQALVDRIIVVGAIGRDMQLTSFTNYGESVDVVAPGDYIYSTIADHNSAYSYMIGTSMAAPHVTGLAGLVWSVNPGLSGADVKRIIVDSADPVVNDTRETVDEANRRGGDNGNPYRLINALSAVRMARGEAPAMTTGTIIGEIVDAQNNDLKISEAIVNVRSMSVSSPTQWEMEAISDEDGRYRIDDIPVDEFPEGSFLVEINAEGYMPYGRPIYFHLEAGVTALFHPLHAIPSEVTVTGSIINAVTGNRVTNPISLMFRNASEPHGEIIHTEVVSGGQFSILLPNVEFDVTAIGEGFVTNQTNMVWLGEGEIVSQDIIIVPVELTPVPSYTPTPTISSTPTHTPVPIRTPSPTPEPSPTRTPWDYWSPYAPPTPTPLEDGTRAPWPYWEFWDQWWHRHFSTSTP